MPLMPGKSKKAFSKNVETEMHEGKPQKQALAIAYSVGRKAKKKKMAEGGEVSASNEKRPMPEEMDHDKKMAEENSNKKSLKDSDWTGQPTVKQAQSKPKVEPIKHPRSVPSNAFSTRLYNQEGHLMDAMPPTSPKDQPSKAYDEEEADKSGPSVPDEEHQHNNDKQAYAKGGHVELEYGSGPENDNEEHPAGLEEDNDQMRPAKDEYMDDNHMAPMLAEGGMAHEMDDQPTEEAHDEHHNSIAAAIMAKRDKMHAMIDSGAMDEDHAAKGYYKGGQIEGGDESQVDLDLNSMEQPNKYYPRNEDEVLKENYNSEMNKMSQPEDSNEHGHELSDEDKHDMVESIRRKMKSKRQF